MGFMNIIFIALIPALALATPTPAVRVAPDAASKQNCLTKADAPFYGDTSASPKAYRGAYAIGVGVNLSCFTTGSSVGGNNYWDRTADGNYIPEGFFDSTCAYMLPSCTGP